MQRAGEELALLAEERGRCMEYLQLRQAEISAALARCQQRTAALLGGSPVPDCSSFASRTPASEAARCLELQYSLGLESLLTKALEKAAAQLSIATTAFGVNSGSGGGSAEDAGCDYECIDEEDEVI